MYKLLTTNNCSNCERVKSFIKNNKLNITIEDTSEEYLDVLIRAGAQSYPVLIDDNGENGFSILSNGIESGTYLATNMEKFKK